MIAEKQILTDPQTLPTRELLQGVMRDNYENYERLLTLLDKQEIITEWNYYKDGKSWLGKAQRKGKTVFWISIWDDCFKLSFFFTEKTRLGVDALSIDTAIKRAFAGQIAVGRLIPLILEIRHGSVFDDVEHVLEYKLNCK